MTLNFSNLLKFSNEIIMLTLITLTKITNKMLLLTILLLLLTLLLVVVVVVVVASAATACSCCCYCLCCCDWFPCFFIVAAVTNERWYRWHVRACPLFLL